MRKQETCIDLNKSTNCIRIAGEVKLIENVPNKNYAEFLLHTTNPNNSYPIETYVVGYDNIGINKYMATIIRNNLKVGINVLVEGCFSSYRVHGIKYPINKVLANNITTLKG